MINDSIFASASLLLILVLLSNACIDASSVCIQQGSGHYLSNTLTDAVACNSGSAWETQSSSSGGTCYKVGGQYLSASQFGTSIQLDSACDSYASWSMDSSSCLQNQGNYEKLSFSGSSWGLSSFTCSATSTPAYTPGSGGGGNNLPCPQYDACGPCTNAGSGSKCAWCDAKCVVYPSNFDEREDLFISCDESYAVFAFDCGACKDLPDMPSPGLKGFYIGSAASAGAALLASCLVLALSRCGCLTKVSKQKINYFIGLYADLWGLVCMVRNLYVIVVDFFPNPDLFPVCVANDAVQQKECVLPSEYKSEFWALIVAFFIYALMLFGAQYWRYYLKLNLVKIRFFKCQIVVDQSLDMEREKSRWATFKESVFDKLLCCSLIGSSPALVVLTFIPLDQSCFYGEDLARKQQLAFIHLYFGIGVTVIGFVFAVIWKFCCGRCICKDLSFPQVLLRTWSMSVFLYLTGGCLLAGYDYLVSLGQEIEFQLTQLGSFVGFPPIAAILNGLICIPAKIPTTLAEIDATELVDNIESLRGKIEEKIEEEAEDEAGGMIQTEVKTE